MKEFTLKRKEAELLKINIGDESFTLPLQGCLSFKEAKSISTSDGTYAFMQKHVPKKIFDSLTIEEYRAIVKAWNDASLKQAGVSLGESQASPEA